MDKTRQSANLASENNIFSDITNNRVGIATTIPQYTLDVKGDINFSGSLNQGGSSFVASRWTAGTGNDIYRLNGDVGIGTTNPTSRLQVFGDSLVSGVVTATTFSGNIIGVAATFTGNVSVAGTLTYEDVTNVDSVGLVTARAGAHVATSSGSLLVGSATETGTASQRLQVTGGGYFSGSVGIGTTRPANTLHLQSTSATIRFTETDANVDNKNWNITANAQEFYLQALTDANSGGGNLFKFTRSNEQVQTFEGQNSAVTWFKVDNNTQRVGIGTTNPQQALHVVGVVTATSYRGDGSQLSGISLGTDITSSLFT